MNKLKLSIIGLLFFAALVFDLNVQKPKPADSASQKSNIPNTIPIKRVKNFNTHHIGSYENGFFMGFVVADLKNSTKNLNQEQKIIYSVLHLFDKQGNHTESLIDNHSTVSENEMPETTIAKHSLQNKLNKLPNKIYNDISIKRFQILHDGIKFGLLTAEELGHYFPDLDESANQNQVTLWPNDLLFHAPWNGDYGT